MFIHYADVFFLAIWLPIIYFFAYRIRNKYYPVSHKFRRYFLPGLSLKIGGALFICFLYNYYYGYGDTISYHVNSRIINSAFTESPATWFGLVTSTKKWYEADCFVYLSKMNPIYYLSSSNYSVLVAGALLGLFVGSTFLPTAVLFAVLSFTGVWALFRTFAARYPDQLPLVATAILFFPSVIVWGSGITKDTLCLFALGWLTHGVFKILIERKNIVKNAFVVVASLAMMFIIKIYIALAFVPALFFWVLAERSRSIRNPILRGFFYVVIIAAVGFSLLFLTSRFASSLGSYSLENISETSEKLRNNLYQESLASGGSAYSLGAIDNSATGLLKAAPAAINVTLYRPYPWEARNVIMLLNAFESLVLLLLTLYLLVKLRPLPILRRIRRSPDLQFFLIFTFIFAFATGISTSNFGTLSRYKIPCLPFFGLFLAVLLTNAQAKGADPSTESNLY